MERDSAMPVKTEPPDVGCNPIVATSPEAALGYVERLIAMNNVDHQTPHMKAIFCRHMADELTDVVGYSFRKLDVSPWGDDERAELAAEAGAAHKRGV
jgi:hypothetical protein